LAHEYRVSGVTRGVVDHVPAISQAAVALGSHHTSYAAYGVHPREAALPVVDPRSQLDYLPSPDGWIDDLEGHRGEHLGYRPYHALPKPKLPFFDGDPIAWPMFIQTFGAQVDRMCNDDSERLALLRSCLSVEIQQELGALLHHPGLYPQCLRTLQHKYGNPRVIAAACSLALLNLQPISDDDFIALKNFSISFRAAVATLLLGGFGAELESSATLALRTTCLILLIWITGSAKELWRSIVYGPAVNLFFRCPLLLSLIMTREVRSRSRKLSSLLVMKSQLQQSVLLLLPSPQWAPSSVLIVAEIMQQRSVESFEI